MLDAKDLEAIAQLMDSKLEPIQSRMDKLEQTMDTKLAEHTVKIELLIENQVTRRLDLLEEGHRDILERLVPRSRVDDLEDEVKFLKSIVRQMNEDLQALKKAQ